MSVATKEIRRNLKYIRDKWKQLNNNNAKITEPFSLFNDTVMFKDEEDDGQKDQKEQKEQSVLTLAEFSCLYFSRKHDKSKKSSTEAKKT